MNYAYKRENKKCTNITWKKHSTFFNQNKILTHCSRGGLKSKVTHGTSYLTYSRRSAAKLNKTCTCLSWSEGRTSWKEVCCRCVRPCKRCFVKNSLNDFIYRLDVYDSTPTQLKPLQHYSRTQLLQ